MSLHVWPLSVFHKGAISCFPIFPSHMHAWLNFSWPRGHDRILPPNTPLVPRDTVRTFMLLPDPCTSVTYDSESQSIPSLNWFKMTFYRKYYGRGSDDLYIILNHLSWVRRQNRATECLSRPTIMYQEIWSDHRSAQIPTHTKYEQLHTTYAQWRSEGPATAGGPRGWRGRQGSAGRSSRRNPLARGPNNMFAGGPKIVATLLLMPTTRAEAHLIYAS